MYNNVNSDHTSLSLKLGKWKTHAWENAKRKESWKDRRKKEREGEKENQ